MAQVSGTLPQAYSNLIAGGVKKRTKKNPFPMASTIKALAQHAPKLPPLRTNAPRPRAQQRAIFAKTKGRGR